MVDRIDPVAKLLDTARLSEIRRDDSQPRIALMVFQVSRVTGAKIVNDENFVPSIQKVICQVRADESAPACYQYSHEIKPNYRTDLQYGAGVGPSVR
jgi:hypothetical protein